MLACTQLGRTLPLPNSRTLLADINFTLESGEVLAVVGPSGIIDVEVDCPQGVA